jgi:putative nucleotidyltransferase with HDIG domain
VHVPDEDEEPAYRTFFSMACLAITVQAAGLVYLLLGRRARATRAHRRRDRAAARGAATAYFILNTASSRSPSPLHPAVARHGLERELPLERAELLRGRRRRRHRDVGRDDVGRVAGAARRAPLYLTYRTYKVYLGRIDDERRHVHDMADLHLATIEALALAIDAKDQTAQSHIRRVQTYAVALARALGMSDLEMQGVKTAALLHDIGKLAVPEHILSKPGPLTQEEFQKIRIHPQVGAEIISAVPFPYPVAPLILSHHERWDGKGYPQGLKGEEIPLGARILSVVDYYDALTSDRPYHKAMTSEAALALLQQEAGRALDPAVVQMFSKMLPRWRPRSRLEAVAQARRLSLESTSDLGRPAAGFQHESGKGNTVFEDIAHAHREIYALYEIAQTMGTSLGMADTMALISSKLTNLVPFSACALFLYDESDDTAALPLRDGRRSRVIGTMVVRSGQGLTGWVARNRRPLVNARPSADFEAAGLTERATTLQSAIVAPLVFGDRFIGTLAVYHTSRSSTPTITAACWTACANRPRPSSTTRSCSSRRRKTRSPIR